MVKDTGKAKTERRPRTDSRGEKARVIQGAVRVLQAPSTVKFQSELGPVFFEEVLEEFARADWTRHALTLAAFLARDMESLEMANRELAATGFTLTNQRGTEVANPLSAFIAQRSSAILSARRSLALHARAQAGDNRSAGKQKGHGKAAQEAAESDDPLIARPQPN